MADVTLIIETDLECKKCYMKIQKVLYKESAECSCMCFTIKKERNHHLEKIRTITCDEKKNTVIISGPFDPVKLSHTLRCKACEAIKDITIVKPEQKKEEEKKPDEKKPEEKKKPEEEKPKPPSTTVNLQFTQVCNLCYPWPCSDPSHLGGVHQYPHPLQPQTQYHQPCQPPPWASATPTRTCGGPAYCGGGCGSCGGGMKHGWPPAMPTPSQMMQPPPMCSSGGPPSCRGCKGCRIVQEGRFIYQDYPQNSCAIM